MNLWILAMFSEVAAPPAHSFESCITYYIYLHGYIIIYWFSIHLCSFYCHICYLTGPNILH